MEKPIFILGCSKSGTTLLRNLFDNYPGLFCIPTETHFFHNINVWVNYYFRRTKPQKLTFSQMKENLYEWIRYRNEKEQQISDGFTKGIWDLQVFSNVLNSQNVFDLKQLSDLYIRALYVSIYNENMPEYIEFVEKSVENAEFALEWKLLYPEARFIHIIRNPYSNLVALRKYVGQIGRTRFPVLKGPLYAMYNSYYHLYKNARWISDYKVIRYEDLITDPEGVMKDVAKFLHIPFERILLEPSLLGKKWAGNSTSGERFNSISGENIFKWKKEITNLEIQAINHWFDFILKDYNYAKISPKRSFLFPERKESLKKYIENRLLWKYLS